MRTVFNRIQCATAIIITLLLVSATPGLAEAPLTENLVEPTLTQQSNVRRLLITNGCAGCDLTGVSLLNAHLIGADLRNADLTEANLSGANLEGADLSSANLTGANLTGAFLTDTRLANAQIVSVNFTNAHLYSTDISGATLEDLTLVGAEVYDTPISVGGESDPNNIYRMEPIIPFEETQPPMLYPEYLLDPIL